MMDTKQFILERMVKIIPYRHRLYELLKYNDNEHWHRFDEKVAENYDKTFCGEVFKSSKMWIFVRSVYKFGMKEKKVDSKWISS